MNTKRGLTPDAGVEKLKQVQNQALKDHVNDIMARFRAKLSRWLAHSNRE